MSKTKTKRSKKILSKDVAFVLNSDLHIETKKKVLDNALWAWTEFDGKYKGCKFWTLAAAEQYSRTNKVQGLRHEHVVPRKYLTEKLLGLKRPTDLAIVFDLFELFAIGAVVTKDEERELNKQHRSNMPSQFEEHDSLGFQDPWLRFKKIHLRVVEPESSIFDELSE